MLIHELDSFSGTPTNTDYLVIDDGTETKKIPAPNVGAPVPDAMTQSEAQNGTNTNSRVLSPYRLKQAINYHAPIPSAMTANEAEAGTETGTRVISPKVLKDSVDAITQSVDKIVEQGSSDGWDWRKYNSGRFEAWYSGTVTMAMTGTIGSLYQSGSNSSVSVPSAIGASSVIYGGVTLHTNSYGVWPYVITMSTSTVSFRGFSAVSRASASYNVRIYIYGRWV